MFYLLSQRKFIFVKKYLLLLFIFIHAGLIHAQWLECTPDTGFHNSRVYFTTPDTGFVIGINGTIQRTFDAGLTWDTVYVDTDVDWSNCIISGYDSDLQGIYFADSRVGYIGGQDGDVFHTTDGGLTWQCLGKLPTWDDVTDLVFFNRDTGIACSYGGSIFVTYNGGQNWNWIQVPVDPQWPFWLESRRFVRINDSTALNVQKGVHRTTDYGQTWVRMNADTTMPTMDISMSDSLHGMVVYENGYFARTTDGGQNWTTPVQIVSDKLYCVEMINDSCAFIGGGYEFSFVYNFPPPRHGIIMYTSDFGNTWTTPDTLAVQAIIDIYKASDSLAFAVTIHGTVLRNENPLTYTGLNTQYSYQSLITVVPNPANEFITVKGVVATEALIQFYDISGRMISEKTYTKNAQINVSELPDGLYLVRVVSENAVIGVQKLVVGGR